MKEFLSRIPKAIRFIIKGSSKPPVPVKPAKPEKKKAKDFASSDHKPFDAKKQNQLAVRQMYKNAIKRKLTPMEQNGVKITMDGKTANGFSMDDMEKMATAMDSVALPQVPTMLAQWYGFQSFIGYQMCAIVAQNWLINKACSMPGIDATRKGWEVTRNDGEKLTPEQLDYIRQRDRELLVLDNLREYSNFSRVFGIRIMMFLVNDDDPKYYENPFNPDGIKPGTYRGMTQIDPYWIAPELDMEASADPVNKHFYEPTWWRMSGLRVHRSHLCVLIPNPVADVLKPTYFFGGVPLTQQIYERVYNAEQSANESYQLLQTKRLNLIFTDLDEALANQSVFESRLELFTYLLNNYGTRVMGEDERFEQHDTSLTDLDSTILTQYQLVAAIAEIPAAKLLGHSPSGSLGQLGEGEEAIYHEMLEGIQTAITPVLDRHYLLLERSELTEKWPELKGVSLIASWPELDAMTEQERADVNMKKAQTDQILLEAGAIDGQMINDRITKDPDSGYEGMAITVEDEPEDDGGDDDEGDQSDDPTGKQVAQDSKFNEADHPRGLNR